MIILKYILMAMFCIPIILVPWMVGLFLTMVCSLPLVIGGCIEAVHTKVYG